MTTNNVSGAHVHAEHIAGAALSAFEQGAGHLRMNRPAVESFRDQFIRVICAAFDRPDRHADWRGQQVDLCRYAEAMGLWAAALAGEEGRRFITCRDIQSAAVILRGYLLILSRWCPHQAEGRS